jgi:hypothetical protein
MRRLEIWESPCPGMSGIFPAQINSVPRTGPASDAALRARDRCHR